MKLLYNTLTNNSQSKYVNKLVQNLKELDNFVPTSLTQIAKAKDVIIVFISNILYSIKTSINSCSKPNNFYNITFFTKPIYN